MMILPVGYSSSLSLYETQKAIGVIKNIFPMKLSAALNLKRVTAPLFVDPLSGLNDDLSGIERPVSFDMPYLKKEAVVVHSLAKWKRLALAKYNFFEGNGLVADMNAIRRDDIVDNIHSVYVDQWDWEKVINEEQRTHSFLHETVEKIVSAMCSALDELKWQFSDLNTQLNREVTFVTSQELEDRYPDSTAKQRENLITEKHGTVFISQIGKVLNSGGVHDNRAPDYDDWELNGDLFFWHEPLKMAIELSSMGIRVSPESLRYQLDMAGCPQRSELPFHKSLLSGELPFTIGGGIGQSRLCMLLLGKVHIGEVQASLWDEETMEACAQAGVVLL